MMCLSQECIRAGAAVRASPVCMLEAAMTCALCPGKNDSPCRPTRLVQPSGLLMEGETLYVVEGLSCTHQQRGLMHCFRPQCSWE